MPSLLQIVKDGLDCTVVHQIPMWERETVVLEAIFWERDRDDRLAAEIWWWWLKVMMMMMMMMMMVFYEDVTQGDLPCPRGFSLGSPDAIWEQYNSSLGGPSAHSAQFPSPQLGDTPLISSPLKLSKSSFSIPGKHFCAMHSWTWLYMRWSIVDLSQNICPSEYLMSWPAYDQAQPCHICEKQSTAMCWILYNFLSMV